MSDDDTETEDALAKILGTGGDDWRSAAHRAQQLINYVRSGLDELKKNIVERERRINELEDELNKISKARAPADDFDPALPLIKAPTHPRPLLLQ